MGTLAARRAPRREPAPCPATRKVEPAQGGAVDRRGPTESQGHAAPVRKGMRRATCGAGAQLACAAGGRVCHASARAARRARRAAAAGRARGACVALSRRASTPSSRRSSLRPAACRDRQSRAAAADRAARWSRFRASGRDPSAAPQLQRSAASLRRGRRMSSTLSRCLAPAQACAGPPVLLDSDTNSSRPAHASATPRLRWVQRSAL